MFLVIMPSHLFISSFGISRIKLLSNPTITAKAFIINDLLQVAIYRLNDMLFDCCLCWFKIAVNSFSVMSGQATAS